MKDDTPNYPHLQVFMLERRFILVQIGELSGDTVGELSPLPAERAAENERVALLLMFRLLNRDVIQKVQSDVNIQGRSDDSRLSSASDRLSHWFLELFE